MLPSPKALLYRDLSLHDSDLDLASPETFRQVLKLLPNGSKKKERAFATGIFNAATSVGAILAPIVVMLVVAENGDGWRYPFLITGVLSGL